MSSAPERSTLPGDHAVTRGTFIAVVGPSGAGKDTLMNRARRELTDRSDLFFVRRVITRPADGATENHIPCTPEAFEQKLGNDGFAFHWDAHGLRYGLPIEIDERIAAGHRAVCNGSRAALDGLSRHYANFRVIEITASAEVLANRLAARGRENPEDIRARLERSAVLNARWPGAMVIDNSGDIDTASRALVEAILSHG
ncbi:phosphonate metabolism protein/1,5-bisphosphokinase (PRPP-forming) PhnN [Hoeflea prorocentri]|uniref:Ribose 1,5-bisphosphate phosphokinase PhnN n=1 Tax=Hoeflea prorocentri TaxID=1922333 RepID=A0A9X3UK34_9HYPH|nr:phosphonate metabolism protein/1,5-bisphosphokinase (PRPP-forming) PhnN [Hoeflea prorocentri]MCY6382031.1 phosphonate metabolism protein/1,5-bisphosphokinase (PRPP-forming) PhnN [Hoeflea prorocentri]MDA5399831.1 phosphonate metabolism protein/1,5-bisphosphokinase (PRPP-forming) PhnN [Hoeflea prorocentri]